MRFRAGTSGYAYKEWRGAFYPEKAKPDDMLRLYAERLGTVEINNTFYRMPTEELLGTWAARVPDGFSFVLKAPQRITHHKRLEDCGELVDYLVRASRVLAEKRGPFLFQLPPHFRKDLPRLAAFLALLPAELQAAFEFRHESWFDDEVYEALRARGVALVLSDRLEGEPPPLVATGRFGYLRLRREHYDDEALGGFIESAAAQPWDRVYAFFKHEDDAGGPHMAERLTVLARERGHD